MIKILLINPPHSYPIKAPPLGLAYIAAILEKKELDVRIIDLAVENKGKIN